MDVVLRDIFYSYKNQKTYSTSLNSLYRNIESINIIKGYLGDEIGMHGKIYHW